MKYRVPNVIGIHRYEKTNFFGSMFMAKNQIRQYINEFKLEVRIL